LKNKILNSSGTISLWAYARSIASNKYIYSDLFITPPYNKLMMFVHGTNQLCWVFGNETNNCAENVSGISTNTWYHIVLSWDSGSYKFYLNNQLNKTGTYEGWSATNWPYTVTFGAYAYDKSSRWDGFIDELFIFNRSITPEEVNALYNLEYNRLASNETRKGEVWHAEVTPNDGEGDGATKTSNNVTIVNERPDTLTVLINGTAPITSATTLTCYAQGEDIDDDTPLTAYYNWYNNSVLIPSLSGTTPGITEGTMSLISTLGNGNTTKQETWTCEVKFNDGFINESIWHNASISLVEISPVLKLDGGVIKLADTNAVIKFVEKD
ncbi:LamG domain-containing protein, partial [Candidatus Woesearchaeota archaeon]|nr:LamG domain-containing protein [Candidatus Woesearchaeota archaeon]